MTDPTTPEVPPLVLALDRSVLAVAIARAITGADPAADLTAAEALDGLAPALAERCLRAADNVVEVIAQAFRDAGGQADVVPMAPPDDTDPSWRRH